MMMSTWDCSRKWGKIICHHLQTDLSEAKNPHVNKLLLCFSLFLASPGTPFQIHGTKVHSLQVTLCVCVSGVIFLVLEENSYCVVPWRSQSLGGLAFFCVFFFFLKPSLGIGAQKIWVPQCRRGLFPFCAAWCLPVTGGIAQFLALLDAWVHLLAPPRPPMPCSLQASPSLGRCAQPMLKMVLLLLSARS